MFKCFNQKEEWFEQFYTFAEEILVNLEPNIKKKKKLCTYYNIKYNNYLQRNN